MLIVKLIPRFICFHNRNLILQDISGYISKTKDSSSNNYWRMDFQSVSGLDKNYPVMFFTSTGYNDIKYFEPVMLKLC